MSQSGTFAGSISGNHNSFGLYTHPSEQIHQENALYKDYSTGKQFLEPSSSKHESEFNVLQDNRTCEGTSNVPVSSLKSKPYKHQGRQTPNEQLTQAFSYQENSNPTWPKQRSDVKRQEFPSSKLEEKLIQPLPHGRVLCIMRGCSGSGKSTLAR